MKRIFLFLSAICCLFIFLSSCGTYRYYAPTANPALFHNKGEVHVSGEISTSGLTTKGAVSLTDHIGIMGGYNSGIYQYRSKEGELAAGFYLSKEKTGMYVCGGADFGSNFGYTDSTFKIKSYAGNFYRPFVQFNTGFNGGTVAGKIKADAVFCLKASYLFYDGKHLDATNDPIHSEYFLFEPAFMFGAGTRVVHFYIMFGLPWNYNLNGLKSYSNARTFPVNTSFGLRFVIGRQKDEDKK